MKFRSIAVPGPSQGARLAGPSLVVPDQSLNLHEILMRFARGEQMPIGQPVTWGDEEEHELNLDIEKLAYADMTEKAELMESIRAIQAKHETLRKEAAEAEQAARLAEEERKLQRKIRIEARKLAKKPADSR